MWRKKVFQRGDEAAANGQDNITDSATEDPVALVINGILSRYACGIRRRLKGETNACAGMGWASSLTSRLQGRSPFRVSHKDAMNAGRVFRISLGCLAAALVERTYALRFVLSNSVRLGCVAPLAGQSRTRTPIADDPSKCSAVN